MSEYLTVAEIYQMQHRLIDMFGGLHGVRDKGGIEAAVFRPQTGYYNSLEEEAAALMESLGNNHGFLDGNKRIAFTAADVFLRRNGFYIEVEAATGYEFVNGSMERREFRFAQILAWIGRHCKALK
ncbi:MAG: type II toxin-antitoxin system death-on-curing family toxin [Candidatus Sulfotelmatobacter sp.]